MKKIFLISVLALIFTACHSDYNENKWVIINSLDKDVTVKVKGMDFLIKSGSMSIEANKVSSYLPASELIEFSKGSHLKAEDGWYYDDGNVWHSVTIKKQNFSTFDVFYDGKYELYATSNLIVTDEGKLKKLVYSPHGKAYESENYELSRDFIFPSQPCYENEVPYYMCYRLADDITSEQKEQFDKADYIDQKEMSYLVPMLPMIRYFEAFNRYVEFPMEIDENEIK